MSDTPRMPRSYDEDISREPWCNHDPDAVTNGMCECGEQVGPIVVTLALTGLPDTCPRCGAPAPDGEWGIGVHGNLLHILCARCCVPVAPVRAVAAAHPHYRDATGQENTPCLCAKPGTYARQAPNPLAASGPPDSCE